MGLRIFRASGNYIKEQPVEFALYATGAVTLTASLVALPILGAVGFTAAGPAAGSAAAAWQASIGLVEAGSFGRRRHGLSLWGVLRDGQTAAALWGRRLLGRS